MVSMAMASERATTTFMLSMSVSEWSSGTPLRRVSRRFCKGGGGEGRGGEGREGEGRGRGGEGRGGEGRGEERERRERKGEVGGEYERADGERKETGRGGWRAREGTWMARCVCGIGEAGRRWVPVQALMLTVHPARALHLHAHPTHLTSQRTHTLK